MSGENVTPLDKYRQYPPELIVLTDWLHDQDKVDEALAVLAAYNAGKLAVLRTIEYPENSA